MHSILCHSNVSFPKYTSIKCGTTRRTLAHFRYHFHGNRPLCSCCRHRACLTYQICSYAYPAPQHVNSVWSSTKTFGGACTLPKNFNFCITSDATEERERGEGGGKRGAHQRDTWKLCHIKLRLTTRPSCGLQPTAIERERQRGDRQRERESRGSSYAA